MIIAVAIPIFFLLIFIELGIARRMDREVYRFNDTVTDLFCGLNDQVVGALVSGLIIAPYLWLYERARLFDLDPSWWGTWAIALIGKDIGYYWFHRFSHRAAVGWAGHQVHHQSEDYNLAVALRQAWFCNFIAWSFYLPLAVIGVPVWIYGIASSINLLYQFWIHTRLIDRMGPLEWILNTPSHHRVHHGCDAAYLDKNYAGMLIIWDRMFGTFQAEEAEPTYGVLHPIQSWDSLYVNIEPYRALIRRSLATPRWIDALQIWLRPPGWTPEGGAPMPAPPGPGRGYDVDMPRAMKIYGTLQFVAMLPVILSLLILAERERDLALWGQLGVLACVAGLSAASFGAMMDRRPEGRALELTRLGVAAGLLGIWAALDPSPGLVGAAAATAALGAVSAGWLLTRDAALLSPPAAP